MRENYTLRRRLLLWVSIPVVTAAILISVLAFAFSWHEIEEVYDAQLVHSAKVLLQLTEHEIVENQDANIKLGVENPDLQHKYEKKTAFRIWHNDRLVTESMTASGFGDFQAPPGFSDQILKGKPWRFFVYVDPRNNLRVETSERYAIRYELIGQLMSSLILPMLLFMPVVLIVLWIGVRKTLKPVTRLSGAVDARHSDDLTAIPFDGVPGEILPLIQALNRLFGRIGESFRREREFTDHAAHELRTPLAAMKTQAQVLAKKITNVPGAGDGVDNLNATIDRATHLIEQLLSLARVQNESFLMSEASLSECIHDVISDCRRKSEDKNQKIGERIHENLAVLGNVDSLAILVRNLLDNAIKYTPDKGVIDIELTQDGILRISDTGPGLSGDDKAKVFGRFVRADKTGQSGSGLGLSIAESIARAHNIDIVFGDNQPHGLVAEVHFGRILL